VIFFIEINRFRVVYNWVLKLEPSYSLIDSFLINTLLKFLGQSRLFSKKMGHIGPDF